MSELIHDRRSFERQLLDRVKAGRFISCDRDWRPAPYRDCRCAVCSFLREIKP